MKMLSKRAPTQYAGRRYTEKHPPFTTKAPRSGACAWKHLLALCLLAAAGALQAAGLGEARGLSRLGEPLRVEIPLQVAPGEQIDPLCVRLAGPRSGTNDDIPWLQDGRITLDGQTLRISAAAVHHPALMLAVRISCGTELRREYTLLLDPPSNQTTGSTPVRVLGTERAAVSTNTNHTALEDASPATQWESFEGETPQSIAEALLPDNAVAQRRFARALIALNRGSLGSNAVDAAIPPGTKLRLPATVTVQSKSPPIKATPARPSISAPITTSDAQSANEAPPRRVQPKDEGRLFVSTGTDASLRMATAIAARNELSPLERERLRAELQLIASLDEKISTQIELSEKLRQLENLQSRLQADSARLEQQIREHQSRTGPAQPVKQIPATANRALQTRWPSSADADWRTIGIGSGAILILVLGGLWLRKRHTQQAAQSAESPNDDEKPNGDGEALLDSLSEDDIWPEHGGAASLSSKRSPTRGALGSLSVSTLGPASMLQINEDVEEHDSAVELAEIMMSFGRVHGAAQTLADFIRANPRQAVKPWIKLLEVYRVANMRSEFEALSAELNKNFNVKPGSWDDFNVALSAPESLENLPHLKDQLCATWGRRECQTFLHALLRDNRQGTRQGFPLAIVDEILLLLAILESQIGPYRPEDSPQVPTAPATVPPVTLQAAQPGVVAGATDLPLLDPSELRIPEEPGPAHPRPGTTTLDLLFGDGDFSRTLNIDLDQLGRDLDTQASDDKDKVE